jgi:thiol-disulfide isomerase/thioredoxin
MKHRLGLAALFLAALFLGCNGDKKTSEIKTEDLPENGEAAPEEDLGGPLEGNPTVEVWNWEQTLAAVRSHQGKVVVLHIWASWNEDLDDPANEGAERENQMERLKLFGFDEFLRLKKLHRDDVATISLNTDFNVDNQDQPPATLIPKVMAFVEARGANFEHGVSSVPEEQLQDQLEIIGTPAALVFDKKGELRQTFFYDEAPFSYREDVRPLVEKLIKEEYTPPAPNPEKADPKEKTPKDEVSLEIRDWKGLQELVAEAKGKVVVVDLWSTTCTPCLKEFPNLVKLHNERTADVACLSFNMDYYGKGEPEDLKADVLAVLRQHQAKFRNVLSSEKDEDVYAQIDSFAVPVVEVYDRAGKLRKRFNDDQGQFTYEKDILPLVETLIAEK